MQKLIKTASLALALALPALALNAQTPTPTNPTPSNPQTQPVDPQRTTPEEKKQMENMQDPQRTTPQGEQKPANRDLQNRTTPRGEPTLSPTDPQHTTGQPPRTTPTTTTMQDPTQAQPINDPVWVGGQQMYSNRNIVVNAGNSKAHSTLVSAVKAAGLTTTLEGTGPFTVFAPVNDAFENLPTGTLDNLMKPESKTALSGALTYHVVPGRYDFDALSAMIAKGQTTLKTTAGGTLTFAMNGKHNIIVKDESGNTANIVTYDIYQSNGVVHSIDNVLMPKNK